MRAKLSSVLLLLLGTFCIALTIVTLLEYPGRWYVYLTFSTVLNALLFLGLRNSSIFFDLFIGGLFWLGYWLKFSVRMAFMEGEFVEKIGDFDYSSAAFDHSLIVVSCGVSGLLLARILRAKFWFMYPERTGGIGLEGLGSFYDGNRISIWIAFLGLILVVSISNFSLGIYQRGLEPQTILPYNLGGIYTWILLFGFATVSALMLNFEIKLRKTIPMVLILIVLFEIFASNVSMLSRGMVLNAGVLFVGLFVALERQKITLKPHLLVAAAMAFIILFTTSVIVVNYVRLENYYSAYLMPEAPVSDARPSAGKLAAYTSNLLLDRWVGMEGAMAVSSYPELGWRLFREVWGEEYLDYGSSIYDRRISKSVSEAYEVFLADRGKHWISMPGILSFFYYPGSYIFLFVAMFIVSGIAAGIEFVTYKSAGFNVILCSLIAFVVAYRYAHFGYVPTRSYLLFGAIALNLALIYCLDRFFVWRESGNRRIQSDR
jgi:hypothetical protein